MWSRLHEAERRMTRCRDPVTRRDKRSHYKSARQMFDRRYRYHERMYKKSLAVQIEEACVDTGNPREFWEHLKRIGPRKPHKGMPGVYGVDGQTVLTDLESVHERWKNDFETLLNNVDTSQFNDQFYENVKTSVHLKEQAMQDPLYEGAANINADISFDEVKKVVMKTKVNKSAGIDNIPYEVLKFDPVIRVYSSYSKSVLIWAESLHCGLRP